MRNTKPITAAVILAALALSFGACGGAGSSAGAADAPAEDTAAQGAGYSASDGTEYLMVNEGYDSVPVGQPELEQFISAKGCSYDDPVYDESGEVDMDASRRVVFRFILNV